jgi:hypothetical protein
MVGRPSRGSALAGRPSKGSALAGRAGTSRELARQALDVLRPSGAAAGRRPAVECVADVVVRPGGGRPWEQSGRQREQPIGRREQLRQGRPRWSGRREQPVGQREQPAGRREQQGQGRPRRSGLGGSAEPDDQVAAPGVAWWRRLGGGASRPSMGGKRRRRTGEFGAGHDWPRTEEASGWIPWTRTAAGRRGEGGEGEERD